jgi:DNA primase
LIECGLIINKADSGSMPLFHNRRIIFPVMLNNNVKTITSRAISNKVLIHHLHTKSQINIFYNHDILDKTEEAYITEGPFDCLSMVQMGYPSVGLFGCQYSPKRFGNWFKNLKKIYIIFDNDLNSSGQKAALKLARELVTEEQSSFIDVYLVELPDGMDCNDLYKLGTHGRTRLRECVKCPIIFKNTEYGKNVMKQKKTQTQQKEYVRTDNSITVLDLAIKYARPKSDLDLHPSEGSKAFFYCPFPQHNDNNPSLVIYPNNTFYCFGCGKYGNAISFLAFYKNITFAKAKKLLEEQEKEITK